MNKIKELFNLIKALVIVFGGFYVPVYLVSYGFGRFWANIWFGQICGTNANEIEE